jgi:hypothetical protein
MTIEEIEKQKQELQAKKGILSFEEAVKEERRIEKELQDFKLNENRKSGVNKIDMPTVLKSLVFIIENRSMPQEEFFDNLLELGCNYTYEDILEQFPDFEERESDDFKDVADGAYLAIIARDDKRMRRYNPAIKSFIQNYVNNSLSDVINKEEQLNK